MKAMALSAAAIIIVCALATAGAQQSEPYSGHGDYQAYCSPCHGVIAHGDGTIAKSLKKRPADLTQLTKRNDGVFPSDRVFKTIDGRKGAGHDDMDMPRWGEVFGKSSESASPEQTAQRIGTLVKYLDTLQAR